MLLTPREKDKLLISMAAMVARRRLGGGKVIRDGMGQSQIARSQRAVDTVITACLIGDHSGIYKGDIGLRDGRIAGIGKAGNPNVEQGSSFSHAAACWFEDTGFTIPPFGFGPRQKGFISQSCPP